METSRESILSKKLEMEEVFVKLKTKNQMFIKQDLNVIKHVKIGRMMHKYGYVYKRVQD